MPETPEIIPSGNGNPFAAPFMTLEQYEDRVFSAGGEIDSIVVVEEYERLNDPGGVPTWEKTEESYRYIPGLYDGAVAPEPGALLACGDRLTTGAAFVDGTGWVCGEESCERNAVEELHSANAAAIEKNEVA